MPNTRVKHLLFLLCVSSILTAASKGISQWPLMILPPKPTVIAWLSFLASLLAINRFPWLFIFFWSLIVPNIDFCWRIYSQPNFSSVSCFYWQYHSPLGRHYSQNLRLDLTHFAHFLFTLVDKSFLFLHVKHLSHSSHTLHSYTLILLHIIPFL